MATTLSSGKQSLQVFVDRCLICNNNCYVAEGTSDQSKKTCESRNLFYSIFDIEVDISSISSHEDLPLCDSCLLKLGQLNAIQEQLSYLKNEFHRLKAMIAFSIVDVVAGSESQKWGFSLSFKEMPSEALVEYLKASEVETLQHIVFEEWHEKHDLEDESFPAVPTTTSYNLHKQSSHQDIKNSKKKTPSSFLSNRKISTNKHQKLCKVPFLRSFTSLRGDLKPSQKKNKTTVISITTDENNDKDKSKTNGIPTRPLRTSFASTNPKAENQVEILVDDFENQHQSKFMDDDVECQMVVEPPAVEMDPINADTSTDIVAETYLHEPVIMCEAEIEQEPSTNEDSKDENGATSDLSKNTSRTLSPEIPNKEMVSLPGITSLEFHQNEDGLFVCMFCRKTFIHKYPYRDHLKTHTGEGPKCPICDKIFPKNHNLVLHLRTHTGEKPFKCDRCSKSFADKSNLKVHYRVHTGERPYKCDYCDQAFVNSSRLVVHRRLHTGEDRQRSFVCHCGAAFVSAAQLINHSKIHGG